MSETLSMSKRTIVRDISLLKKGILKHEVRLGRIDDIKLQESVATEKRKTTSQNKENPEIDNRFRD